ncbi:MAG: hypothetical protein AB8F95_01035 [Bacteroidia bacterium]
MKDQEQHSELEAIYQDNAWKAELRRIKIKKQVKALWLAAGFVFGLCIIWMGWKEINNGGADSSFVSLMILIAVLGGMALIMVSGFISLILSLIPFPGYSLSERMEFLFPTSVIAIEIFSLSIWMN